MGKKILLIEDDTEIASYIVQGLNEEGFLAEHVNDGKKGEEKLHNNKWDLVILDWWLPGRDGLTLLQDFRASGKTTPVIFLTARDAIAQRVEGLKAGAEDYLCKPFAFDELVARVQGLLKRTLQEQPTGPLIHLDILLDPSTERAERKGNPLSLTAREHALLVYFLRHPEKVLSRATIFENVWKDQFDENSNTIEVHVMELRKKLEKFGPRLIHTVRGRGYKLGHPNPTPEK